jgi:hypothetical protein
METYWGIPAEKIGCGDFWRFVWEHRAELRRYLGWVDRMQ